MVSFGRALEQLAKSDNAKEIDLANLFQRLSFDSFDTMVFSVALFPSNHRLVEQGKETAVCL